MPTRPPQLDINGHSVERAIIADSWLRRLTGLLFVPKDSFDAIWLSPCRSIHTIGMRYAIDILFLDQRNKVVGLKENLQPLRVCNGPSGTQSTIELPAGGIKQYQVSLGTDVSVRGS